MILSVLSLLLGSSGKVNAASLESTTSLGAGTVLEAIQFDSEAPAEKISWVAGLSYNHSTDKSVTPNAVTNTPEVNGGLHYKTSSHWSMGSELIYAWASQPTTLPPVKAGAKATILDSGYRDVGVRLFLGHTFGATENTKKLDSPFSMFLESEKEDEESEEDTASFTPTFEVKAVGSVHGYSISESKKAVQKLQDASKLPALRQSSLEGQASFSPWEWLSVELSYARYFYNNDPADFLSALESSRPTLRAAYSGLSNAVSGFPQYLFTYGLTLAPFERLSFEYTGTLSYGVVDHANSYGDKLLARYELTDNWKVGLGAEHDRPAEATVQTLGVFEIGYSW